MPAKQGRSPAVSAAAWWKSACGASAAVVLALVLTGCGGGGSEPQVQASGDPAAQAQSAAKPKVAPAEANASPQVAALAAPTTTDPGMLLLLVPDGTSSSDSRIAEWTDAALETGTRMTVVTDSDFIAMGDAARKYGGLVLPDDIHSVASDSVIAAVRSYVNAGGRAMLTYDFGALYQTSAGVFYAAGKSRLSDLAGVDYVLYDELLDRTIGIGPVTGMRSTLRLLQVPPGKSMPYTDGSATAATSSPGVMAADTSGGTASTSSGQARYLPPSTQDPGGVRGFDFQQFNSMPLPSVKERKQHTRRPAPKVNWGKTRQAPVPAGVTQARPNAAPTRGTAAPTSRAGTTSAAGTESVSAATSEPDVLDAYSGYYYGYLSYPSYVTRGAFAGTVLATSPQHGLVAGVNNFGNGQVLFVNLPLSYLKGRTDGLPLHGFLSYFVRQMGHSALLSPMPNGVGGLNFNWHLDSKEAQAPTLLLEQRGVFSADHLFSIHMTAGPDAVTPGDGLGWNLNNNTTAKRMLKRFSTTGHDVGSHGGWIHDYWGAYASETNEADFLQYLQLNRKAVDGAIGKASRSYSAPEGNNPLWAMTWLEQQGVVGAYFLGHTGLGATRHWRDGVLKNPKLYVIPLTPKGTLATFEEFQEQNIPRQEVIDWYHALVDFSIEQNTNRMIYAHPPGAAEWPDVLDDLLAYAKSKGTSFRWYTMTQLADHMARRAQVTWGESLDGNGQSVFTASHPTSLAGMAWRLPKAGYQQPVVTSGSATVTDQGSDWQVQPTGKSVVFRATRM